MVNLLNLLDPDSLVDKKPRQRPQVGSFYSLSSRESCQSTEPEGQHSALSKRGIASVGGVSAVAWYLLRLALRDRLGLASHPRRDVIEHHALSTIHSLGWLAFLLKKLRGPTEEWPRYCSRALVASP